MPRRREATTQEIPPSAETIAAGEAATREALSRADSAIREAGEAASAGLRSLPAEAGITRDTTINVAAQRLARDLAAIPGIERFGALRLGELDRAGPRPLRTMWRVARAQLAERYGDMTIGEIVDRYRSQGGSSGTHA
jgi:hypothetical protein